MELWMILGALGGAAGMFMLGWVARGLAEASREAPEPEPPPMRRWRCPGCEKRQVLPANLGYKVMICNACNQRLVPAD